MSQIIIEVINIPNQVFDTCLHLDAVYIKFTQKKWCFVAVEASLGEVCICRSDAFLVLPV